MNLNYEEEVLTCSRWQLDLDYTSNMEVSNIYMKRANAMSELICSLANTIRQLKILTKCF